VVKHSERSRTSLLTKSRSFLVVIKRLRFRMKRASPRTDLPERIRYTKYYEHDGMLRAYANRAMLLAMLFAVIAMSSLGFAIYVRVLPPTVVRVDEDGNATAGCSFHRGEVTSGSVFIRRRASTPDQEKSGQRGFLTLRRLRRQPSASAEHMMTPTCEPTARRSATTTRSGKSRRTGSYPSL
jgi:hypothetical protein